MRLGRCKLSTGGFRTYLDELVPDRLLAVLLLIHQVQGEACKLAQLVGSQQLCERLQNTPDFCPFRVCMPMQRQRHTSGKECD